MSDDLHKLTDLLNTELKSATEWLKRLNYGVRASVPLLKEEEQEHRLAFGKYNGDWALIHLTVYSDGVEEEQPLLAAPREYRVLSTEHLNDLLLALGVEVKRQAADVNAAIERVQLFRQSMSHYLATRDT